MTRRMIDEHGETICQFSHTNLMGSNIFCFVNATLDDFRKHVIRNHLKVIEILE